jgi:hypothetical protein
MVTALPEPIEDIFSLSLIIFKIARFGSFVGDYDNLVYLCNIIHFNSKFNEIRH